MRPRTITRSDAVAIALLTPFAVLLATWSPWNGCLFHDEPSWARCVVQVAAWLGLFILGVLGGNKLSQPIPRRYVAAIVLLSVILVRVALNYLAR